MEEGAPIMALEHLNTMGADRSSDLLLIPEVVLPEQFFGPALRHSLQSGEQALMLAVLEDAIRCFQGHLRGPRSNPRALSRETETWIVSTDYDWPFSFNNVCEALGIDPDALRRALLSWRDRELEERTLYRLHLRANGRRGALHTQQLR